MNEILELLHLMVEHLATSSATKQELRTRIAELGGPAVAPPEPVDPREARIAELEAQLAAKQPAQEAAPPA